MDRGARARVWCRPGSSCRPPVDVGCKGSEWLAPRRGTGRDRARGSTSSARRRCAMSAARSRARSSRRRRCEPPTERVVNPVVVELARDLRELGERATDVEVRAAHRSPSTFLVMVEQIVDGARDVVGRSAETLLLDLGESPGEASARAARPWSRNDAATSAWSPPHSARSTPTTPAPMARRETPHPPPRSAPLASAPQPPREQPWCTSEMIPYSTLPTVTRTSRACQPEHIRGITSLRTGHTAEDGPAR